MSETATGFSCSHSTGSVDHSKTIRRNGFGRDTILCAFAKNRRNPRNFPLTPSRVRSGFNDRVGPKEGQSVMRDSAFSAYFSTFSRSQTVQIPISNVPNGRTDREKSGSIF